MLRWDPEQWQLETENFLIIKSPAVEIITCWTVVAMGNQFKAFFVPQHHAAMSVLSSGAGLGKKERLIQFSSFDKFLRQFQYWEWSEE